MISYSYKKLQNKIRKYFSFAREVKDKENNNCDLTLFASPNDLLNFQLEKEYLERMNAKNFYFKNYDFFQENGVKEDYNNINNKKIFDIDKINVIIPEFKNELIASLTNGKEFKLNSQNILTKKSKKEANTQIKEYDIENEYNEVKKNKEKKENVETNKEKNEKISDKNNVFLTSSVKINGEKNKNKSYKRLLINESLGENNNRNDKRGICVYLKY